MTYTRDKTVWGSADGTEYLIKDLTTPHLVNILNWMRKENAKRSKSYRYRKELIAFLEGEAEYRVFYGFMENSGIPVKKDSGQWVVTNLNAWQHAKSLFYKYKTELKLKYGKLKERGKLLIFKRLNDRISRWKEQRIQNKG